MMSLSKDIAEQYNIISNLFDASRVRIWNNVKKFLTNTDISQNKLLLDAGCGNGKNSLFALDYNYDVVCIDISEKLLQITSSKGLKVNKMNILDMNYDNVFDKCICIAVIHHINSIELQCKAILNLIRSLKQNGELLISVWSLEKLNDDNKYRDFVQGDNYIDWVVDKKNNHIIKRYYYIHNFQSFKSLLDMIQEQVDISYQIYYEKQNWFTHIVKL